MIEANDQLKQALAENSRLREAVKKNERELKIEESLEKVRAVALTMSQCGDMMNICQTIAEQLKILGCDETRNVQTAIFNPIKGTYTNYEYYVRHNKLLTTEVDYLNHPLQKKFAQHMLAGVDNFFEEQLHGKEVQDWYEFQKTTTQFPDCYLETADSLCYYWFSLGPVALGISTYKALDQNDIELFKRFRNVFELAYKRFLDILQAMSQAREAKIEAALERVRGRTMAMRKSDELGDAAIVLFNQVAELGIKTWTTGFNVWSDDNNSFVDYIASPQGGFIDPYTVQTSWTDVITELGEARKSGVDFFVQYVEGERLKKTYIALSSGGNEKQFEKMLEGGFSYPSHQYDHFVFGKNVSLMFITYEPVPEAHDIFKRFGKVFEQTYTRYLDLQKAETQAREAQIELSLERVRSKAMAMQSSGDLLETISVFYHEVETLSITPRRCGVGLIDKETRTVELSTLNTLDEGNSIEIVGTGIMSGHPILENIYEHWLIKKEYHPVLRGQEIRDYYQVLKPLLAFPDYPDDMVQYGYFFFFPEGGVYAWTEKELTEDELNFYRRFTSVLSLTYKRYKDLQNAEFQTHKAQIETALERVRARALAMQNPEELVEVSKVLRYEMGLLGVEELETCSIYINDESLDKTECWYALKDQHSMEKKLISDHFTLNLQDTWVGRQMLKFYNSSDQKTSIVMKGDERKEWIHYCEVQSPIFQGYYGDVIPDRTYHLYKFSQGAIGAASAGDISNESWDLLKRAASVFSLAYSRFRDLTQARLDLILLKEEKLRVETALSELKSTQTQLIQAEKMASLGELTAGIAHEIQNPLNFVNNFSEVNIELSDEILESLLKGDVDEAKILAADIKTNQEKIRDHGKRADGIVKSMLHHSRTSSGKKELIDVNILADEYLRLAYHGTRAKDKDFNADFEFKADQNIPKVNVIPQDLGRVLLNLLNNAFYAVKERKKIQPEFQPKVTVATSIGEGVVRIVITDNGIGIPDKLKEKIFQPFFTTKPTGEGTGLGLSLSYDIVTKGHGGNITVETEEFVGSSFTIELPTDGDYN